MIIVPTHVLARRLACARRVVELAPQDTDGWQRFAAPFREGPRGALIGLPLGDYDAGYTNSVAGLS